MRWVVAFVAAVVCTAGIPGVAAAGDPAAPAGEPAAPTGDAAAAKAAAKATAEDLYQQGIALAQQGKWADAAARLEESNRIDPAPGTGINLADCYEHLGKVASAWSMFVEAASVFGRRTPPDPRAETAKTRAEALYPKLSRLTIEVPEAVRATKGLVVRRDGQEVGAAQLGTAIAIDPGEHVVEVSAPGKVTWKTTVKVEGEAAKVSVPVPVLQDAPPGGDGGAADGAWPWQKKVAIGAGGVGAAGLVVGAIFGGLALGNHDELAARCAPGEPRVCDAEGLAIANDQKTIATVSTIGFAAGGALLAAGVVLWVVAPSSEAAPTAGEAASVMKTKPKTTARRGVWIAPRVGGVTGLSVGAEW